MIVSGLYKSGNRKRNQHKRWRKPKEHFGEMVQLDGSIDKWIIGSNTYWTLVKFMDDATKTILFAEFYDGESTENIMDANARKDR